MSSGDENHFVVHYVEPEAPEVRQGRRRQRRRSGRQQSLAARPPRHFHARGPSRERAQEWPATLAEASSARCNCSGHRRSTLAGLIELFEQKLAVDELQRNHNKPPGRQAPRQPAVAEALSRQDSPAASAAAEASSADNCACCCRGSSISSRGSAASLATGAQTREHPAGPEQPVARPTRRNEPTRAAMRNGRLPQPQPPAPGQPRRAAPEPLPEPDPRKLASQRWQPPLDGRQYGPGWLPRSSPGGPSSADCSRHCSGSATRVPEGADCATSAGLVRHSQSNSRRLLQQLAKVRRLAKPDYSVRRPEKVAQIEALIEQLDQVAAQLADDELLLERAERRDLPAARCRHQCGPHCSQTSDNPKPNNKLHPTHCHPKLYDSISDSDSELELEQRRLERGRLLYGRQLADYERAHAGARRQQVPELEARAVELSHRRQHAPPSSPARAGAPADDLAARRLAGSSPTVAFRSSAGPELGASYLLYSSAAHLDTTDPGQLDRRHFSHHTDASRQLEDDLHARARRSLPPEVEPPFGIPRPLSSSSAASASWRRRRQTRSSTWSRWATPNRPTPTLFGAPLETRSLERRPRRADDSRVSFVDDYQPTRLACLSADSGVPLSAGAPTPSSPELAELRSGATTPAPPLEQHTAVVRATPTRARPTISLDQPRAKSPLLRTSTPVDGASNNNNNSNIITKSSLQTQRPVIAPSSVVRVRCYQDLRPSMSQLECSYLFADDDDDDDDDHNNDEYEDLNRKQDMYAVQTTLGRNKQPDMGLRMAGSRPRTPYRTESSSSSSPPDESPTSSQLRPDRKIEAPNNTQSPGSPRFSIGSYTGLGKRKLIIL